MKKVIVFFASLFLSMYSFAQGGNKIYGLINANDEAALQGATIELLKASDSSLIKVALANKEGKYEFENILNGQYILSASAVGYQNQLTSALEVSSQISIVKKDVQLQRAEKSLNEVKVIARKPFVEQKIDRTIINVEASISNTGSNALEVLEKSPGVTVDKDGNISLKGRQGVMIMVDGKPSYLSGENLTNYLRSLPATALDQIEIMTNPPAKYDAAGNSGVINIKTKKNKANGFNGSVSLGYTRGKYGKTSNSLNLNYKKNKFNFFTNINAWSWQGYNDLELTRNFFVPGTKTIDTVFKQHSFQKMLYPGVEGKFGVDYTISQKTTAGITITGNYENGRDESENTSFMSDASGNLAKIIEAQNLVRPNYRNVGINSNLRHKLDSTGKEISFDVDYIFYDFSSAQNLKSRFFNADRIKDRADENLKGDLPSIVNIYSAKSDYTYPLKSDAKLEAGIKYSHVTTDNNAQYFLVQNDQPFFDSSRSNHFLYTENIAAAYINYNKQWKKWGVQLGLRGENTIGKGEQKVNNQKIDRNIFNLFPTMYVSYAANDKNQFAASFGRRIERPSYQDLNPFRYFLDPYTYQEGNPFLKPQFSYNYQLSHNYKSILNTSINYNKTTDIFAETLNQYDSLKITYVYKDNISTAINYGISVSANFNVTKWWSTSLYTNVTHNQYQGLIRNKPLNVASTIGTINMSNQLKFGKGWSGEVGGFARTKGIEGQILINPMGQLNFGVQKQILKTKGTLKLSVKDAFYTMPFHGKFEFHNIDVKVDQSRDSRTVGLTFNYRFGKAAEQKRQRQSGAEDEQNRVKKGGGN